MSTVLNEEKAQDFLWKNNVESSIVKIAGDASNRSYYRVAEFILMFAPPKYEDVLPFIKVDEFLIENGFLAPKIFAKDIENGFLLLEDFGDDTYGKFLQKDKSLEIKKYQNAVDCLIKLGEIAPYKDIKNYNHEILFREVMLFVDFYLKFEKKITLDFAQIKQFKKLWFELFDKLDLQNRCVVLRDYHADNLMVLDGEKVGLLDFQDALFGSKAYDLVSLLEDARRDVDRKLAQKMLRYYIDNSGVDEALFLRDYEILSLQRNIKILGIFCRLIYRDKKENYAKFLPRVKKYVDDRILNSQDKTFAQIFEFIKKIL